MTNEITPTRARQWRTEARQARAKYLDAVATFRAAMATRRAAERTLAALPSVSWPVVQGLAQLAGHRAWIGVADRAVRASPQGQARGALERAALAAEDAAGLVWDARLWHRQTRARVRLIDSGAVTVRAGAAWSDRGLANVRTANGRRP